MATSQRAAVHGRVVAADTAAPLRGALVVASAAGAAFSTRTDDQGRFTLEDLPPAEYSVTASRSGYIDQGLGQPTPMAPARRLTVGPGANAGPLNFALTRWGVITGRVVDAEGVPVDRIQVQASRLRRFASEWRLLPAAEGVLTDDLGEYRLFGLPTGDYIVSADPERWRRDGIAADGRGDVRTYAPSTTNPADALKVHVEAGRETQADVILLEAPVVSVGGSAVDSRGAPVRQGSVRLEARGAIGIAAVQNGVLHHDGSFSFDGVSPGSYRLRVASAIAGAPSPGRIAEPNRTEYAAVDLEIGHVSLTDVMVRTTTGGTVRGRLALGPGRSLAGRTVYVTSMPLEAGTPASRGLVQPDLTFAIEGVYGPTMLRLNGVPAGWWTRSVHLDDRDVTDRLEVPQDGVAEGVVIHVSATATGVRGTVRRRPAAADDTIVLLFARDPDRWLESPVAAGITLVRPTEDGAYSTAMRPGAYHAIAVPAAMVGDRMSDPDLLAALAPHAQPVDIHEDAEARLDLTVWEP